MHAVDFNGKMNDYILDPDRKISKAHLESVCKPGQQEKTCRYVGLGPNGFFCAKNTPMKSALDERAESEKSRARGDNCDGLGEPPESIQK